jgi:hypothetical protein
LEALYQSIEFPAPVEAVSVTAPGAHVDDPMVVGAVGIAFIVATTAFLFADRHPLDSMDPK